MKTKIDIFAEAREKFSIGEAWHLLGLDGDPKLSCRSPFRAEKTPSFTVHSNGTRWHDHGTGDGGDVVEFVRVAIGGSHKDARDWFAQRLNGYQSPPPAPRPKPAEKKISWPAPLISGTRETWSAFAKKRGFTFPATHTMVQAKILQFCVIDGKKCFVVSDESQRAAEIRAIDGSLFGQSKAFPLSGVDKSWPVGTELLKVANKSTSILLVEGATDLLSAIDLFSRYRREHGGKRSWRPLALLGASCRNLHPEAAALIRGHHVRIVPDADSAGDTMAEHWQWKLRKLGCAVDVVALPIGSDLTDNLQTIDPQELFQ